MKHSISLTLSLILSFLTTRSIAQEVIAPFSENPIMVDGTGNEEAWSAASWHPIDQLVYGENLSPNDFSGRFKAVWNNEALFILAEIVDDSLSDQVSDPLVDYWHDDCLEIYVDEDNQTDEHRFNHNAFAYHISTLADAIDLGTSESPILLNSHVETAIHSKDSLHTWECKIKIYDKRFNESPASNGQCKLRYGKTIGFAVAYCDNDGAGVREHFILSNANQGDTGWLTTEGYGTLYCDSIANTLSTKDELNSKNAIVQRGQYLHISNVWEGQLMITDILGKLIMHTDLQNGMRIRIPQNKGFYFVSLSSKGEKFNYKIISK